MQPERNSLIAIALLFMAGCSAARPGLQSESVSHATDPVPMPIRHADEYDFRRGDHEYEPAPSSGDRSGLPETQVQPPVPTGAPVPAPSAIGISRVKSVSWLRGAGRRSNHNNCGDVACGDGCSTSQKPCLLPEYFTEGCGTTPHAAKAPPVQCQKGSGPASELRGWNQREKSHRRKRIQTPFNCGEGTARDPGFILPEGCNSSEKGRKSNRHSPPVVKQYIGGVAIDPGSVPFGNHRSSLADPMQDDNWDDHGGSHDQRFTPDELLDLPSTIEAPSKQQSPQNFPNVPSPAPTPPVPNSPTTLYPTPAIQPTDAPAADLQHTNSGSVKRIVQPPMWPRLSPAAVQYSNTPVVTPAFSETDDAPLPTIHPGRRI